jgi:hypothetical protein
MDPWALELQEDLDIPIMYENMKDIKSIIFI